MVKPRSTESKFVRTVQAQLLGDKQDYLITAYTHDLEINKILEDGKIQLVRRIRVNEGAITDITPVKTGCGKYRAWLIIAFNETRLQFRAFKTIDDDFIVDDFPMKFRGTIHHLIPGSLKEDSHHYFFTCFAKEGCVFIFRQIGRGFAKMQAHPNFKTVMKTKDSTGLKFFIRPEIWTYSMFLYDNGYDILTFDIAPSDESAFVFSLVRRNGMGQYFYSNPMWKEKMYESYIDNCYDDPVLEPVAPISTVLNWECSLLFSKTSIYLRGSPYNLGVDQNFDINSIKLPENVEMEFHGAEHIEGSFYRFVFSNREFDVIATAPYLDKTLIIERNGDLSLLTLKMETDRGFDGAKVEELSLSKIEGSLPSNIQFLMQLKSNVYITRLENSTTLIFKIDNNKLEIIQELIDNTIMIDGEFYKRELPEYKFHSVRNPDGKSEYIAIENKTGNVFILNKFEVETDHFDKRFKRVLDYKIINDQVWVLQKNKLIQNAESESPIKTKLDVIQGKILDNGEITTLSNGLIKTGDNEYKVSSSSISVIDSLRFNGVTYVVSGHWDGSITIYSPTSVIKQQFSIMFVTDIRLLEANGKLYIIVGSHKGEVGIFDDSGRIDYIFIGEEPVVISPAKNNKVIASTVGNALEIEFNENGLKKTYLDILYESFLNRSAEGHAYAEGDDSGVVGFDGITHEIQLYKEDRIQRFDLV
ncbi:hypothetical protein BN7_4424 [Wickerhamomyces ciferrii]|uniref:Uncharacterized protein n=1 Tax=Wickerhamomyces ciferrii (strain ATCC 14091 / BCRC 22168 / CBS 111 / JCM 3599 / NBRC 0793 / NRRL Y-1031 F-60-10) TaxID=1206466 RepID=K0KI19_WICCF|nr:uncharacterized protein BN7_4424 [Wickerhamomyces ciferrii]CCH44855.1 hypothetical protein BN7_4424 [Wickerhamomyces ciferrii]